MGIAWDAHRGTASSLLDAIGRTPLVRLSRMGPSGHDLLAKVEWYGPSGSLKDRIYAHMIARAEERGELRPGMTLLECSTGNAGTACAFVAAVKGYPCIVVMPEGMSEERKKLMRAYGAELVFIPSATSRGLSEYLWRVEQVSHALANGYYVGTINRVGIEPLGDDDFYGQSYFCDPRGQFVGEVGDPHKEELLVRDLDLDKIDEVRQTWQFIRDRRPDAYGDLVRP